MEDRQMNPYRGLRADVNQALDELHADESHYVPQKEAEELFLLPECVHIFFVRADGCVSTFSEPSTLRIFRFKDGGETFIQVGGWTHPLISGASPILEAGNGAFMFPDAYEAEEEGAAVGIVIADETPFNVEGEAQVALAKILDETTSQALKKIPPDEVDPELKLGKIGKTLVKSAQMLSKGMEVGAEKATDLIEYVGEKQRAGEAASIHAKVNPALKTTLKGAMYATTATVKVSGFVADRVGKLSRKTADYLAKKAEKKVIASGPSPGAAKSSSSMHSLVDAARGGLYAYATVYDGLEKSSKVLGKSIKDESVRVIKHQYGDEAGETYKDSMTAAGNAAMTYMNVQSLGVKGLLKKTAKNTGKNLGKAVLEHHSGAKAPPSPATSLEQSQQK